MTASKKKPYRKPSLKRVVLVPEENVLAVCYDVTGGLAWPNANPCYPPSPTPCSEPPTGIFAP